MKSKFNMIKTQSLQWKLLSRFFLILMFLLLIMESYQYITMKKYLYKSNEEVLEYRFRNVPISYMKNIQTSKDLIENSSMLIEKMLDANISVSIIDNNGNIIASDSKSKNLEMHKNPNYNLDKHESDGDNKLKYPISIPKLPQDLYIKHIHKNGNLDGYILAKDENKNLQVIILRKIGNGNSSAGLVQLSTPAGPIEAILLNQIYTYIGASILVLIVGALLGLTIFKYTLKPLYNVTNTVKKINADELNTRLPLDTGQIEIDTLSKAFNDMLQRIELSFEQEQYIKEKMRQFISDASHELRTPLTSIHGFVEVLLRGAAKDEKKLDLALNSILIESERLTKLVNDLLLLTRLERKVPVEIKKENISHIIEEVYPQLQILAKERKLLLQLEDNLFITGNRNQFKQVIFNLVQNAVHHTDEKNGVINISTSLIEESKNKFIVLKISDNGTGIPKEQLNSVFDRFFRSESHRSRKHGGYGLGLSIVKSIIEGHDGKIEVVSDLGLGAAFIIYLKPFVETNDKKTR